MEVCLTMETCTFGDFFQCIIKYSILYYFTIWTFPKIVVSPKSSILIGFSIINHPFWGTTIVGNPYINGFLVSKKFPSIFFGTEKTRTEGWYLEVQEMKKQGVGETQRSLKREVCFLEATIFFDQGEPLKGGHGFFCLRCCCEIAGSYNEIMIDEVCITV